MEKLRERGLVETIRSLTQPVLGICIGVQLLCRRSEEGDAECIGIFDNEVRKFTAEGLKVPHMGWNSIGNLRSPLLDGIAEGSYVYYVHSYAPTVNGDTIATTVYGETFSRRDQPRQLLRDAVSSGKKRLGRRTHPTKLFNAMIEIIPAIDLIGGQCVRLTQGDYDRRTTYYKDPLDAARRYEDCGIRRLHLVDLDGAKAAHPVNLNVLERITVSTSLQVQYGGGIKNAEALRDVFGSGAARAICGSIAVTQPDAFREWLAEFGSAKMILGADTRDGRIAINGWLEAATVGVEELIGSFRDAGLSQVICTDIAKDGMLSGPSVPLYLQLQKTFPEIDITVSGGISSWEDIEELDRNGLRSVVVGKAIYEGRIRFEQLEKYMLTVRTDKKQQRC